MMKKYFKNLWLSILNRPIVIVERIQYRKGDTDGNVSLKHFVQKEMADAHGLKFFSDLRDQSIKDGSIDDLIHAFAVRYAELRKNW